MTDTELDSSAALAEGIAKGDWPHTMDAREWTKRWMDTLKQNPGIPADEGTMLGWFANAIMAGYDQGNIRLSNDLDRIKADQLANLRSAIFDATGRVVEREPGIGFTCDKDLIQDVRRVVEMCQTLLRERET